MTRNFGLILVPRHIAKDLHTSIYCRDNLRYVTGIVRSPDLFKASNMLIGRNNKNEPVVLTVNTLITRHSTLYFVIYGHRLSL